VKISSVCYSCCKTSLQAQLSKNRAFVVSVVNVKLNVVCSPYQETSLHLQPKLVSRLPTLSYSVNTALLTNKTCYRPGDVDIKDRSAALLFFSPLTQQQPSPLHHICSSPLLFLASMVIQSLSPF
jgi:hypothetical protein